MTTNRTRRAEHFRWLADDVWDGRLPALWVVFSAGYLLVGRVQADSEVGRWLSSLAVTIAGVLVVLMFVRNALARGGGESNNNTGLAGLIATVFVSMEAYRVYGDILGSIFAGVFGAMIFLLLWLRASSPWHRRVRVTFAVMLLPAVVYSLIQLLATVLVWEAIGFGGGERQDVPIAAHVSGIVSGISAFVLTYNAVGSTAIWGRDGSANWAGKLGWGGSILLVAGIVVYLANRSYLGRLGLDGVATSALVVVQVAISVSVVACVMYMKACRGWNLGIWVWCGMVLLVATAASMLNGTVQHALLAGSGRGTMEWVHRVILVEAIPMSALVVSTVFCYWLCGAVLGLVEGTEQCGSGAGG